MAMERLLIVGAGLTGALTSAIMKNAASSIDLWEKSRGAGGRMSTSRNPNGKGIADVGAQYISASQEEYTKFKSFYDELLSNGILAPFTGTLEGDRRISDGTKDFITPSGVNSIAKYYLKKSGANVCYNERVSDISQDGDKWLVASESGKTQHYDGVILTIPVPQILQLQGGVSKILGEKSDVKRSLEDVKYSSRYALGLFYEPGTKIDVPWCAKYIDNDDCVRFVAIDNKKRAQESSEVGPSVVVHSSVPFGIKHIEENVETVCKNIVLPRVLELVPELPKPSAVKTQKWRYSQVSTPYRGAPGAISLNTSPLLVCAGDAFIKSGFNGCVQSALAVSQLASKAGKL